MHMLKYFTIVVVVVVVVCFSSFAVAQNPPKPKPPKQNSPKQNSLKQNSLKQKTTGLTSHQWVPLALKKNGLVAPLRHGSSVADKRVVSPKRIARPIVSVLPVPVRGGETDVAAAVLRLLDTDQDYVLSFSEASGKLQRYWGDIDLNADASLDAKEIGFFVRRLGTDKRLAAVMPFHFGQRRPDDLVGSHEAVQEPREQEEIRKQAGNDKN